VTLIGYDRNSYILHDSNWYGSGRHEQGACRHVQRSVFLARDSGFPP
jgi:hypothetical protein